MFFRISVYILVALFLRNKKQLIHNKSHTQLVWRAVGISEKVKGEGRQVAIQGLMRKKGCFFSNSYIYGGKGEVSPLPLSSFGSFVHKRTRQTYF